MDLQNLALNLEDFVRIRNNSQETISGRYDGRDYEWPPGHYLDVHKVVATHIFGYCSPAMIQGLPADRILDIRQRALLRLGWLTLSNTMEAAKTKLRQIAIEPIPPFPNVRILRREDPNIAPEIQVTGDIEQPAPRVAPGPAQTSSEAQAPEEPSSPPVVVPDVVSRRKASK